MIATITAAAILFQAPSREPVPDAGRLVHSLFASHGNLADRMERCGLNPDWAGARVFNSQTDQSSAVQLPVTGASLAGTADWRFTPDNSVTGRLAWTWEPLNDAARRIERPEEGASAPAWSRCLAKDAPHA